MAPRPQPPPRYSAVAYESVPATAETEAGADETPEKRTSLRRGDIESRPPAVGEPCDACASASTAGTLRRWVLLAAACLLLAGAFCRAVMPLQGHSRHPQSHGDVYPMLERPRPSDFNELFSGPGVELEKFRFGVSTDNVGEALQISTASETLHLSVDDLGVDVWRDRGSPVAADPPYVVNDREEASPPPPSFGGRLPGNMLIRPEPARVPHSHDSFSGTDHAAPVCFGPLKYVWQGPESFVVDLDQFERLYMLVKSSYVVAHIRVVDEPEIAQPGKVVIKPKILMAEAGLNQILEVSELDNSTRKAKVLKIGTPAWDEGGNGRYNCIRAYLDVVFPPKRDEPPNAPPVMKLFGAGTIRGEVDHGRVPPLGTLVGWAVHGCVRLSSAVVSQRAVLAARDGAVKARFVHGDGDVHLRTVNGPIWAGLAPTGESSSLAITSVNSLICVHVWDEFSGRFNASTINGVVKVSGDNVKFDKRGHRFAEGTYGSGNQIARVETVNGPVRLHFGSFGDGHHLAC